MILTLTSDPLDTEFPKHFHTIDKLLTKYTYHGHFFLVSLSPMLLAFKTPHCVYCRVCKCMKNKQLFDSHYLNFARISYMI